MQEKEPVVLRPRLVVFDWDGTILDTTAAIAVSIQYACERLGLPVPATKRAKSVIGLGWRDAMRIVAPTCTPEDYPTFASLYTERYRPAEAEVHLFEGIVELLDALRAAKIELAVATGKSRRGLNRVLEQTGLADRFADTQTADENLPKPNPAMLEAISIATGYGPEDMVMVGDTTHDMLMARAWGCPGVAVSYGAMTPDMLAEASPAAICADVAELARTLGVTLPAPRR